MSTGKHAAVSLTTAGSNMTTTTAWSQLSLPSGDEGVASDHSIVPQVLQLSGVSSSSSGSAVCAVRWYDSVSGQVIKEQEFDVTVTAVRTALAGSSGSYVCTIASDLDGTDKFDLLPYGDGNPDASSAPRKVTVYIGVKSFTTMTNITFYPEWTRAL